MKFATAAAAAALVAGASASYNETVYTTEVVTAYTTYCPAATTLTHGTNTYTVTAPTTLTITDCPCTISKPVYSTSVVQCSTWYLAGTQEFKNIKTDFKSSTPAPLPGTGAPGAPTPSVPGAPVPYPTGNATVPAGSPSAPAGSAPGAPGAPGASTVPAGSETPSPSSPAESGSASASASAPISTGAASKGYAPAGLAGLLGLAAYLL